MVSANNGTANNGTANNGAANNGWRLTMAAAKNVAANNSGR